jgi:precorrin-6B methylase 2
MRNKIRSILYFLTGINSIKFALNPITYIENFSFKIFILFNSKNIFSGKFKNLKFYNNVRGSEFKPKYFGTYEDELNEYFQDFVGSKLIDIGCDDGYYSIGLLKNNFVSKVYAFEFNNTSITNCKKNIVLNNLNKNNIILVEKVVQNFNSISTYLNRDDKFLIKSDIEGGEYDLFSDDMIKNLYYYNCNLIIETHINEKLEQDLIKRFEDNKFFVKIVNRNNNKNYLQKYSNVNFILTMLFRKHWLNEHRPKFNRWIVVTKNII